MTEYPGYKKPCNGCGICCLAVPCAVSSQFGLWNPGQGCGALRKTEDRYICDVIADPGRLSADLAKIPEADRVSAIGVIGLCDHRAASSFKAGAELLQERNLMDELAGNKTDTYPRSVVVHQYEKKFFMQQSRSDFLPTVEEIKI